MDLLKLVNPSKCKREARADCFLSIAQHLVRPNYDWAVMYKVTESNDEAEEKAECLTTAQSQMGKVAEVMNNM